MAVLNVKRVSPAMQSLGLLEEASPDVPEAPQVGPYFVSHCSPPRIVLEVRVPSFRYLPLHKHNI